MFSIIKFYFCQNHFKTYIHFKDCYYCNHFLQTKALSDFEGIYKDFTNMFLFCILFLLYLLVIGFWKRKKVLIKKIKCSWTHVFALELLEVSIEKGMCLKVSAVYQYQKNIIHSKKWFKEISVKLITSYKMTAQE